MRMRFLDLIYVHTRIMIRNRPVFCRTGVQLFPLTYRLVRYWQLTSTFENP